MSDDVLAVLNSQNSKHDDTPTIASTEPVLTVWPQIRQIIENSIVNAPRSLQKRIGPSELGTDCVHCLAAKLAGWQRSQGVAWLPFIGTCVHEHFEHYFTELSETVGSPFENRFETEKRVTVGRLQGLSDGYDVSGSIDLWDKSEHATVDWKIVGSTTLRSARAHSPSQQYQVQASLYGLGLVAEGETVERSCVFYLPRTSMSLNDAFIWEHEFQPELGQWALQRAQLLVTLLDTIELNSGVAVRDAWISMLPRSESHCFDCSTWPDSGVAQEFSSNNVNVPEQYKSFIKLIPSTAPMLA